MNNAIFREYDIRGNVERDLTDDVVKDIARAFGTYMVERGKKNASISRDCRLSSDHLRDVVIEGMVESGLDVIDIGITWKFKNDNTPAIINAKKHIASSHSNKIDKLPKTAILFRLIILF